MWYIYSCYLNSTLCSWIIKPNYLVVPLIDAAPLETKPSYSYVVDYNACSWCEAKSNQNILNRLHLE